MKNWTLLACFFAFAFAHDSTVPTVPGAQPRTWPHGRGRGALAPLQWNRRSSWAPWAPCSSGLGKEFVSRSSRPLVQRIGRRRRRKDDDVHSVKALEICSTGLDASLGVHLKERIPKHLLLFLLSRKLVFRRFALFAIPRLLPHMLAALP